MLHNEGVQSYFYSQNEVQSMETLLTLGSIRADGREKMDVRPISFEFSINSAIVHIGKTLVSCSTSAEIIKPTEERPSEGLHQISLQSPNRISKSFQTEALVQIRDCLHRTRALDLESLVLKIGEEVWCLKSDIVVLNNDGGLYEAANLALIGSLLFTKLPGPRGPRPVVLHHLPIAVTFGYLNTSKSIKFDRSRPYPQPICFADPTYLESLALDGFLTIFANAQGEICAIHKNGGVPLSTFVFPAQSDSHVNIAIEHALQVAKQWHVSLMKQMGELAPPSLANIIPLHEKEEEKSTEHMDIESIEQSVLDDFRKVGNRELKEDVASTKYEETAPNNFDEDEEIDPSVLAFFS